MCSSSLFQGDSLSVNLINNRAMIAVGTAALSSDDMYMAGNRGKGVRILHFYGKSLSNAIIFERGAVPSIFNS